MGSNIATLKTDQTLLTALKDSAGRKLTPAEIMEQRVSFVYGSMDSKSAVTKERIKQVINEQAGVTTVK